MHAFDSKKAQVLLLTKLNKQYFLVKHIPISVGIFTKSCVIRMMLQIQDINHINYFYSAFFKSFFWTKVAWTLWRISPFVFNIRVGIL